MANQLHKLGYSLSQAFRTAWKRVKESMTCRVSGVKWISPFPVWLRFCFPFRYSRLLSLDLFCLFLALAENQKIWRYTLRETEPTNTTDLQLPLWSASRTWAMRISDTCRKGFPRAWRQFLTTSAASRISRRIPCRSWILSPASTLFWMPGIRISDTCRKGFPRAWRQSLIRGYRWKPAWCRLSAPLPDKRE